MLKFNPTFRSNFFERDIKFAISSKCIENGVSRVLKCLGFVSHTLCDENACGACKVWRQRGVPCDII
jgi:hypothetical protein